MFVTQTTDSTFFFSATSFYPGREANTSTILSHLPSRIHPSNEHFIDIHDGETEIESEEEEWFTEPQPVEPGGQPSSKTLEATLVEVSTFPTLFFFLKLISIS
jgi:hypothetical protein